MTRRIVQPLLILIAMLCALTGCMPGRAAQQTAELPRAQASPTARPATPTPKRATATPMPPTATALPPTATALPPTAEPPVAEDVAASDPAEFAVAPDSVPDGWNAYDKSTSGFTFALPPEWRVIDLERKDADQLMDESVQASPELRELFNERAQRMIAQGLKVIACDCSAAGRVGQMPSNLNVVVEKLPYPIAMDMAVDQTVRVLEAIPMTVKPIKHTRIEHPSGPAEAFQYRMRIMGADGKLHTAVATQYMLLDEHEIVAVTIISSIKNAEAQTRTYYKMIQTFRLISRTGEPM